jgi:DNA-binding PadR family transcriptional regulator
MIFIGAEKMSTVNLMILGALQEKPMNAYEMKKMVENRNLKYWVKISSPSIYKNLVKLHQKGYLDGEVVREGEMPEKTVYTINGKGRQYFMSLMKKYATNPGYAYFDFSTCIANLHNVDTETGLGLVVELKEQLQQALKLMDRNMHGRDGLVPYNGRAVMDLYEKVYLDIYDWIQNFEKEFRDRNDL